MTRVSSRRRTLATLPIRMLVLDTESLATLVVGYPRFSVLSLLTFFSLHRSLFFQWNTSGHDFCPLCCHIHLRINPTSLFRRKRCSMAHQACVHKLHKVCLFLSIFHWAHTISRFQVVVFSAYKQMRAQSDDILSDINEDNYDRAFSFLRPGMDGSLLLRRMIRSPFA